jgi:hypothetical protein
MLAALAGLVLGGGLLVLRLTPLARGAGAAVGVLAVGAAVGALAADGAATGWAPLDVALRGLLAAAVTLASSRGPAGPTVWLALTALAGAVVAGGDLEVLGAAAAGVALAPVAAGRPSPELRALAVALAVQSLLRLDWPRFTGASASTVAVAVLPVLWVAGRALGAGPRRAARAVLAGAAGFCLLGAAAAAVGAAVVMDDIDRGLTAGSAARRAIGAVDTDGAAAQLRASAEAFADADRDLGAWWARPAYAVPIVAQHTRAVRTMARTGADLVGAAEDALTAVDPSHLEPRNGRVDLRAVERVAGPLAEVHESLIRAAEGLDDVGSPWLLGPVADRHRDLTDEVRRTGRSAALGRAAAELGPGLLGGEGPRRYLLVIQTPAEARGSGGFMGNWGELSAVEGRLTLSRFGRITELNEARQPEAQLRIRGHDAFVAQYGRDVVTTWGVNNFSPDFETVARILAQLYPQSGGSAVDGVIGIDPYGLAALLEVVGPTEVAGWPEPLTADNAAQILLHDAYVRFAPAAPGDVRPEEERVDFLSETAEAAFGRLLEGGFGGPAALADALGPAVDGRRLQLVALRTDEHRLFRAMGATGAPPPLRGDSIGVVGQNFNGNKIDWFLRRSLRYDVEWDPGSGRVRGDLRIDLTNDAPSAGLPPAVISWGGGTAANLTRTADGENLMLVSVYSAFPLTRLELDGAPLRAARATEAGRRVYTAYVSLPAGTTRTLTAATSGSLPEGDPYRLDPVWQPTVRPDRVAVRLAVPDGWRLRALEGLRPVGARAAAARWTFTDDRTASAEARRGPGLLDRLREG